jgi:hypothetical protein
VLGESRSRRRSGREEEEKENQEEVKCAVCSVHRKQKEIVGN